MAAKKVVFVLPPRDFDGAAYEGTRRVLEGRGHKVSVTSIAQGTVTSQDGLSVPVDVNIKDIKTYDYDAFVFIGGEGAPILFDDERVRKLAKDVKYKTIGATGNATVILALSDVLEKRKATGPFEYADLLVRRGASFSDRPLEIDGKVITLQDTSIVEQFANAISKAME